MECFESSPHLLKIYFRHFVMVSHTEKNKAVFTNILKHMS